MNKKTLFTVLACVLCLAIGIGGAYAYLSRKTETKTNTFNVVGSGTDGMVVVAEEYTETEGDDLAPKATVSKAVRLKTTNMAYDAYGYLMVEIPTVQATISQVGGVYDVATIDADIDSTSGKWTLVASNVSTAAGTDSQYLYRVNTNLTKGTGEFSTADLFSQFQIQDFTELNATGDIAIKVTGAVIQTEGIDQSTADNDVKTLIGFTAEE